jgi:hypothetical protein
MRGGFARSMGENKMRVIMRGYYRDHGSFELAEEELDRMDAEEDQAGCPEKRAVLLQVRENGTVTQLKYRRRVRVSMNGNYVLEVSLTSADAAKLCWLAFRNSALSALARLFGAFESEEIEVEKMIAESRKVREEMGLRRRKLLAGQAESG